MLKHFKLQTAERDVVSLTEDIKAFVEGSGIREGLCTICTPHTTAGLTVTSFWDPNGFLDLQDEICRLIPTRIDFKHQHDTPQDAAGHVKSSLIGVSFSLPIHEGKLLLGHSQGIYFLEFDGPRNREYFVKLIRDPDGPWRADGTHRAFITEGGTHMRLSTSTNIYFNRPGGEKGSLDRCIRFCGQGGYRRMDLNFVDYTNFRFPFVGGDYQRWIGQAMETAALYDITFGQAHAPFYNFCDPLAEGREEISPK